MDNITKINYVFKYPISNCPEYVDHERVLSFIRQQRELNGTRNIITEFIISHFNKGKEIPELERSIKLYSDGEGGVMYPKGLDLVDGSIVCNDYTMLTDIDFYINWIDSNKGEKKLFELIVLLHDVRQYNKLGQLVQAGQGEYSLFDLKYFRIVK